MQQAVPVDVLAIVVPLAGALGYIGKVLITAFTRNIDRQQDLAERHLSLLSEGVVKQGVVISELILQIRAHQVRNVEYHQEECESLKTILRHWDQAGVITARSKGEK